MQVDRLLDSLQFRLFWMRYGSLFFRRSQFRVRRVEIGRKMVRLSVPTGEEQVMDYEIKAIFHGDCYGLRNIEGTVNTILDVGGNLGFFVLAARSCFPNARIHCYEPNPRIQSHLLSNTRAFDIEVFHEAVGPRDGRVNLKADTGSLLARTEPADTGNIKMTAIAKAIDRLGGSVDLLKLDCEGMEWELFEELGAWNHVRRLTMEYHLWARPAMEVPEMIRTIRQHCHPVERGNKRLNDLKTMGILCLCDVSDMNFVCDFSAAATVPNCRNALRKNDFCSSHRVDSSRTISPLRPTLPRQPLDS